jgi:hypothetical protein
MKDEDINTYCDKAASYTDFKKEGNDMFKELKVSKILCNSFQDAIGTNVSINNENYRSQINNQTWLNKAEYGARGKTVEMNTRLYMKNIK